MQLPVATTDQNYNSIDLCKLIMALFVVAIHTNPLYFCSNTWILTLYNLIVRLAVPFFFLSTGYFLGVRLHNSGNVKSGIALIVKYLRKILHMYLLWSAVYFPLAVYYYCSTEETVAHAFLSYVRGLLLVGEHFNSWHLWYLLSTIYALLFVIFLSHFKVSPKGCSIFVCCICLFSIGIDRLMAFDGSLPLPAHLLKLLVRYTIANGRILQGIYYIPLGMLISSKPLTYRCSLSLFVSGLVCDYFIADASISSILAIVTSIALFNLLLHVKLKNHRFYPAVRKISTDIYLIHMYVWTIYYSILYGTKTFGVDCFLITASVSFGLAVFHQLIAKLTNKKAR